MLDTMDVANVAAHAEEWEKVVVKLRAGLMPPSGVPRPEQAVIDDFASSLEAALDRVAAEAIPNPGRTEPFHRLNRAEYQNAIRDLLSLDIDATTLLPTDEVSYGFDNIAGVLKLSPLLTERYLNAAQKVARLALGTPAPPNGELYRVPDQLDQDVRLEGMPVGTRGGTLIDYFAPRDGEYDIKARLGRGIDYDIPHFIGEQNLEISVDGERVQMFTLPATPGEELNIERQVFKAPGHRPRAPHAYSRRQRRCDSGRGRAGATEARRQLGGPRADQGRRARDSRDLPHEDQRGVRRASASRFCKPYIGRGPTDDRETREGAALRELEIMGPLNPGGAATSPSYRRVFVCHPAKAGRRSRRCAKTILSTLARRAYRRPVTDEDVKVLLDFYNEGPRDGRRFDAGIELALQRILVSPSFLFRTEFAPASDRRGPVGQPIASATSSSPRGCRSSCGAAFQTTSCWIWRCRASCASPAVLEQQTRRMLADPRSQAFTDELRRAVAVPAPAAGHRAGSVPVSRLRRHAGAGVSAGGRAVLRQHRARGPADASSC